MPISILHFPLFYYQILSPHHNLPQSLFPSRTFLAFVHSNSSPRKLSSVYSPSLPSPISNTSFIPFRHHLYHFLFHCPSVSIHPSPYHSPPPILRITTVTISIMHTLIFLFVPHHRKHPLPSLPCLIIALIIAIAFPANKRHSNSNTPSFRATIHQQLPAVPPCRQPIYILRLLHALSDPNSRLK